ncbi:MAG: uroporphyrinogen decarboxylase family protein [Pirellulaceae bacterium]
MTNEQWETLLAVIAGEAIDPLPVGFIIDSPWLPGWSGMTLLDYYTSESLWLEANLKALRRFPRIMFLPGFWSEWGMCTEPSAFGAKCTWHEDAFPFPEVIADSVEKASDVAVPNPRTDGLAPFVLKRLLHCREKIESAGHHIKFAVARGPLNIAAFLVGNNEFLMGMKLAPTATHTLLGKVTDFLVDWIQVQVETFPSIEGIFLLDDIVGFCGEQDYREFVEPYMKRSFGAVDAKVRFFHNDAPGRVCAPHLQEFDVNLFNFAFDHPMAEMQEWVGGDVALLGNIPPREVMAQGAPEDVCQSVASLLGSVQDRRRIILSCGGGMPPHVPTENIEAFLEAAGY